MAPSRDHCLTVPRTGQPRRATCPPTVPACPSRRSREAPGHPPRATHLRAAFPASSFSGLLTLQWAELSGTEERELGTFAGRSSEAWVETGQKFIVADVVSVPADFATGQNPEHWEPAPPPPTPGRPPRAEPPSQVRASSGGGGLPAGRTGTRGQRAQRCRPLCSLSSDPARPPAPPRPPE